MHSLADTESVYLIKCKKVVYLEHRRFLSKNHVARRKGKHFKGETDHRNKPIHRTGDDVFGTVKDLEVIFRNAPCGQSVPNKSIHCTDDDVFGSLHSFIPSFSVSICMVITKHDEMTKHNEISQHGL
jgi:hypothetical protein